MDNGGVRANYHVQHKYHKHKNRQIVMFSLNTTNTKTVLIVWSKLHHHSFLYIVSALCMQWSITLLSMVKYQKIKVVDTKTRDLEAVRASAHKAFGSIHLLCCCNEVFPITLETNVLNLIISSKLDFGWIYYELL